MLKLNDLKSIVTVTTIAATLFVVGGCASSKKQTEGSNDLKVADNDGDGIPNGVDTCPNEKGLPENYGCANPQLVEITKTKLVIHDKVYFANDSDAIEERSHALLDAIVAALGAHDDLKHIRVEGHSDNTGDPAYNVDLSQRRAAAVVAYLTSKGVSADRFEAKGVGPTEPVASNDTEEGRAKNRRVEFIFFTPQGL